MEISKLYETASEKLNEAKEKCSKSETPFSSITIINTDTDNTYIGVNWKKLNDSFEEEKTCSEYEAICKMLLAGENSIASIVTLEPDSKIPNCPCSECQKLIIRLNPDKNRNAKILTGKNSQVVLTSLNNEIAEYAEFFSFGTNDLTQMTFGYSRDDAEGKFLKNYVDQKILSSNPFETLDQKGVGQLIEMSMERGKAVNSSLVGGICGEHGGDPDSVKFAHRIGLNYVSCSPFRIPQARLAAAQAVVESKKKELVHA